MIGMLAQTVRYLWALPVTLFGLIWAMVAGLTGGRIARVSGVLEVSGGWLRWLLPKLAPGIRVAAITLGHVVLATDQVMLDRTRLHERVHVAQCERWGPLFPLLYCAASLRAWRRGLHYYRDNAFELEARLRGDGR